MRKIYFIICLFSFIFFNEIKAQEAAIFTQYHINPVLINPGYTGFNSSHNFLANYRGKWSAFPGAPKTFTLIYDGEITDRLGLGGQILSDRIGANNVLQFQLNYAYKFKADLLDMGIGLSTGLQSFKLVDVINNPLIEPGDILVAEGLDGVQYFDASFGLYGSYDESFQFGLSFPNLVRSRITDIQGDIDNQDDAFGFILYLGYKHEVTNYNFTIEPSLLVRQVRTVPFHADINVKFSFLEDQLIGGLTYGLGSEGRIGFLLGTRINDLRLYYSYDINLGPLQQYNNGSHEFSIGYRIARSGSADEAPLEMN